MLYYSSVVMGQSLMKNMQGKNEIRRDALVCFVNACRQVDYYLQLAFFCILWSKACIRTIPYKEGLPELLVFEESVTALAQAINRHFAASRSRGSKQPCCRGRDALGTDNQISFFCVLSGRLFLFNMGHVCTIYQQIFQLLLHCKFKNRFLDNKLYNLVSKIYAH